MSPAQIALLAASWLAYGALHSLFASLAAKRLVARRFPRAMRGYRLAFNVVAVVLLVPPLWLTLHWEGAPLWQWRGGWGWLADGLALAALGGIVGSARAYGLGEFAGTAQWRSRDAGVVVDRGVFRVSPLHRYVRHPWYALALVILWTRDMDAARLVSTLCVTLYFVVGLRLEERKLLALHGEAYARYRRRVNALVPWPGRILGADEARRLEASAAGDV